MHIHLKTTTEKYPYFSIPLRKVKYIENSSTKYPDNRETILYKTIEIQTIDEQ